MRTKIYNILYSAVLLAIFGLFVISCDEDDYTGYSTMKVKSPTMTITPGFSSPVVLVENGEKFEYTVTLSEAQIVDVHLTVSQVGGTASADDYEMTGTVAIPAGSTSGKGSITILSDELIEEDETLIIQIGDATTANAALTPVTVEFTIKNLSSDDLEIGLSWEPSTPTTDDTGTDIDPTALADLRLLITDSPYTTVLDEADGAAFEDYTMLGTMDDGEYLVVADFYDAMSAPIRDLDLMLDFNQLGILEPISLEFPAALSTRSFCPAYYFVMAKITKSGSTYAIEEVGEQSQFPVTSWSGVDATDVFQDYTSHITTTFDCDGDLIFGLNVDWMWLFWGESVEEEGNVYYTIDESGVITIESQYIFTTLYDGDLYDYTVEGTGIYDDSGDTPTMTIQYTLDQEGFSPSQWAYDNGYMATPYFEAVVTMDSDELKSASLAMKSAKIGNFDLSLKPRR